MQSRSFKDMSLAELDKLIQSKRDKSIDYKNHSICSKDSFLKESITIIHPPNFQMMKQSDCKNPPPGSLYNAIKDLTKKNKELENTINLNKALI